jgi:hypothetical protein
VTASELTHAGARERFGVPDEVVGSVNDPRTFEENSVRWNEKWVYLLEQGDLRIVYWHRYDCRGVVLASADGSVSRESL